MNPTQSGSQEVLVARARPVKNSSESPGKNEVRMNAVSKKMIRVTAKAT
jgi:hypothetical protein